MATVAGVATASVGAGGMVEMSGDVGDATAANVAVGLATVAVGAGVGVAVACATGASLSVKPYLPDSVCPSIDNERHSTEYVPSGNAGKVTT